MPSKLKGKMLLLAFAILSFSLVGVSYSGEQDPAWWQQMSPSEKEEYARLLPSFIKMVAELGAMPYAKTKQMAEAGNVDAQFRLGGMYFYGVHVPKNESMAVQWYKKAATLGDVRAQGILGRYYENHQNFSQAVKYYQAAALNGQRTAQFDLYKLIMAGKGTVQNENEATEWLKESAAHGYDEAQLELGKMYLSGLGVPQDIVLGVKWLRLSALQGNTQAVAKLRAIKKIYDDAGSNQVQQSSGSYTQRTTEPSYVQPIPASPQPQQQAPPNYNCNTVDYGGGIINTNCSGY